MNKTVKEKIEWALVRAFLWFFHEDPRGQERRCPTCGQELQP